MLQPACEAAPAQAEPLQRRALQTGGGIDKWRHVCDKNINPTNPKCMFGVSENVTSAWGCYLASCEHDRRPGMRGVAIPTAERQGRRWTSSLQRPLLCWLTLSPTRLWPRNPSSGPRADCHQCSRGRRIPAMAGELGKPPTRARYNRRGPCKKAWPLKWHKRVRQPGERQCHSFIVC